MASFGEKLRKEREQRKITLDDISSTSKISTRMLQALEEEHFEQLPGGVFNKGFVRAYARHIGLDEEQAVSDYLKASGQTQDALPTEVPPQPATALAQADQEQRLRSLNNDGNTPIPWKVLAAIVVLAALAFAVWTYYHHAYRARPAADASDNLEQHSSPAPSRGAGSESGDSQASRSSAGSTPSDATPTFSRSSRPDAPVSGSVASPVSSIERIEPASSRVDSSDHSGLPSEVRSTFTLVIRASEDSWITVTADGRTSKEELLVAGAEKSFPANREVQVKAGNVGGLQFLVNGRQLPPQGDYGEVKTLSFDSGGIRHPSP